MDKKQRERLRELANQAADLKDAALRGFGNSDDAFNWEQFLAGAGPNTVLRLLDMIDLLEKQVEEKRDVAAIPTTPTARTLHNMALAYRKSYATERPEVQEYVLKMMENIYHAIVDIATIPPGYRRIEEVIFEHEQDPEKKTELDNARQKINDITNIVTPGGSSPCGRSFRCAGNVQDIEGHKILTCPDPTCDYCIKPLKEGNG